MDTFTKLKEIVLPNLVNFKDDLLVYDKKTLKKYKGKFLYAYRDCGTNLLLLDNINDFDYTKSIDEIQNILNNVFTHFKGANKNFLFCDGETISPINWEELHTIFKGYASKVYNRKTYIDSLNIDAIAFDLFNLMARNRLWKTIILENQTSDTLRRLRNRFRWVMLKKSNDLEDIKKQLLQLVL